jgi:alkylation response protein AidB-like acyl-CoA dehydrogenase
MTGFTLELNEDQTTLQKWLHEFSENVIRPPRPSGTSARRPLAVIQEAAKAGIYSLDFFASSWGDESGISLPITMEELFWGDAGIGLSIVGTTLGVAGILSNGTLDQIGEWVPQCFGDETTSSSPPSRSPSPTPAPTSAA